MTDRPVAFLQLKILIGILVVANVVLNRLLIQDLWFHDVQDPLSPSVFVNDNQDDNGETMENYNMSARVNSKTRKEPRNSAFKIEERSQHQNVFVEQNIPNSNNTASNFSFVQISPHNSTTTPQDYSSEPTKTESEGWSTQLKEPCLNATRLLQSGHFDRVVQSWARAFSNKSSTVCSLKRLKLASRAQRRKSMTNSRNRPNFYREPVQGILYVKVPKSGSSTLASINQRIALHWGHRLHASNHAGTGLSRTERSESDFACTHAEGHVVAPGRFYGNRLVERSFLWGSIRDPASRALSRVFFSHISQSGLPANDKIILNALKHFYNPQVGVTSNGKGGFQLQYLSLDFIEDWFAWGWNFPTVVQQVDVLEELVKNVTQQYDFIAVAERMDESLVALQLLLGLRVGDILSSSTKVGGGYYYRPEEKRCVLLEKSRRSPAVKQYLESDEWQAVNYGDYLLYAAVNRSLDLTIEQLGKDRFAAALTIFREAKRTIDEVCLMETHFPCSENGTVQLELSNRNCYQGDEGCGFSCIDRIANERGW